MPSLLRTSTTSTQQEVIALTSSKIQLHPGEPALSAQHAHQSLAANFIGLDFIFDVGDLLRAKQTDLPPGQKDYWTFAP